VKIFSREFGEQQNVQAKTFEKAKGKKTNRPNNQSVDDLIDLIVHGYCTYFYIQGG
jgi:hypothetical protein